MEREAGGVPYFGNSTLYFRKTEDTVQENDLICRTSAGWSVQSSSSMLFIIVAQKEVQILYVSTKSQVKTKKKKNNNNYRGNPTKGDKEGY